MGDSVHDDGRADRLSSRLCASLLCSAAEKIRGVPVRARPDNVRNTNAAAVPNAINDKIRPEAKVERIALAGVPVAIEPATTAHGARSSGT